MITRRALLTSLAAAAAVGFRPVFAAEDWRRSYPTLNFGVISSENESDRVARHTRLVAYLERSLRVSLRMHHATDYAGTIEALKARKLEFARFGPAAYAKAWLVTGGKVEPVAVETDKDGAVGYHSVVAVRANSPYHTLDDLKGKTLAWADPNSTSGFVAPRFFLRESGIEADRFFGRTGFSGSHENSVIALLNGTYDAVVTWWTNEERSNVARMEGKGMIPPGQVRNIWKSPKLPNSPWTVRTDLPDDLRRDVKTVLLALPTADPQGWKELTDGKNKGLVEITHKDYEPIIRMVEANLKERRS
ncbi:MAG TPA: phosphate/phosphite/phosphonate ABC transporter substrate-binding protein [Methylomirabilota bacterium]|jgi:phosphonate transport system substrate-binding protein